MTNKNLTVYKSNDVIQASYKLTLNEQRVILACIGQVDSSKPLTPSDMFELSAKDFSVLFNVSDKTAYEALTEVTESLFNRYVIIHNPYPDKPKVKKLKTRWISAIGYTPDEGKIALKFAQDMLPYLSELKNQFTRYKLEYIGKMTSIYGVRLYEYLMQWQSTGKFEISLERFKSQLELPDSYDKMCNLKAKVIDPALKDINTHSNLTVSYEQRKTGRVVSHFIFTFTEKKIEAPKKKPKKQTKVKSEPQENIDYYIDLIKRFGKTDAIMQTIPPEILMQLSEQAEN